MAIIYITIIYAFSSWSAYFLSLSGQFAESALKWFWFVDDGDSVFWWTWRINIISLFPLLSLSTIFVPRIALTGFHFPAHYSDRSWCFIKIRFVGSFISSFYSVLPQSFSSPLDSSKLAFVLEFARDLESKKKKKKKKTVWNCIAPAKPETGFQKQGKEGRKKERNLLFPLYPPTSSTKNERKINPA